MGKKGGSETSTVELPKEIERAANDNLDIANEVGALGYQPNRAAAIAGFSPGQINAMQGFDQQSNAFGMPSSLGAGGGAGMGQDELYKALTGMDAPGLDTGMGFKGYSGAGVYDQAIESLPPAYRAMIESFVMNPETGAAPTNLSVPQPKTSFAYNPDTGRMEASANPNSGSGNSPNTVDAPLTVPYNRDWDVDVATGKFVPKNEAYGDYGSGQTGQSFGTSQGPSRPEGYR